VNDLVVFLYNISFQNADEVVLQIKHGGMVEELNPEGIWVRAGNLKGDEFTLKNMEPWSARVIKLYT
jgi:hypothetical protein